MLKTKIRTPLSPRPVKPLWILTPAQEKKAERLITEDGKPVDNPTSAKQMRLLSVAIYESWTSPVHGKKFMCEGNVGIFYDVDRPPVVPDNFLSLGVEVNLDMKRKGNRAYFFWDRKKAPEVVIEIVSNKRGGEKKRKVDLYAALGVRYYVVFDPDRILGDVIVERFVLENRKYRPLAGNWLDEVGLGLSLWEGRFENRSGVWLRWSDANGVVLPTGGEKAARNELEMQRAKADTELAKADTELAKADTERAKADTERAKADTERAKADTERAKAETEKLRALLKSKGIDPEAAANGKNGGKH